MFALDRQDGRRIRYGPPRPTYLNFTSAWISLLYLAITSHQITDTILAPGSLYYYAPTKIAPIHLAVFYVFSGALHCWQSSHYKSWRVTWIYAWSSLLFISGYILRAITAFQYDNLPIFLASIVLLYAAPPVYELGNYLVLGRCLHYVPHLSPIHPDRTLTLFLALSTVVEALTASGAVRVFNADVPNEMAAGKALLKTSLVLQLFVMVVQLVLGGVFHSRVRKSGILKTGDAAGKAKIEKVLITLYLSCLLITARTIFRTVEYFVASKMAPPYTSENQISPLIRYELYFWVFEAMPMAMNSLLLNIRHPGKYLPRNALAYLGQDGVERDGAKFGSDRRPLWLKIVDPLDLVRLVKGGDEEWWLKEEQELERHEMVDGRGEKKKERRGRGRVVWRCRGCKRD